MTEQSTDQQLFLDAVKSLVDEIRRSLCTGNPTLSQLADSARAVTTFKLVAATPEVDSFRRIADQLDMLFDRHIAAQTIPNTLELELIELAIDWLAELAILYGENLPEPRSLVSELLYTFRLVESSQDAVTLAELVATHAGRERVDPFSEDPEFSVIRQPVPAHHDPFADDPGFGLEFDLLQRTVNRVAESKLVGGGSTPSVEDGRSEGSDSSATSSVPAYDFFADDPPVSE